MVRISIVLYSPLAAAGFGLS